MNEKDNWLKLSFFILLSGGCLFLCIPPALFFKSENIKIIATIFTLPIFSFASVLIPCYYYHGKDIWKELELKPLRKSDIKPVLSVIPIFFIFGALTALWKTVRGDVAPQFLVSYAQTCPLWIFILILFSAGILAPISEELVFRRTIAGFYKKFTPAQEWLIYFVPSLLFAISHGIIWQSFLLFFFALYLQRNQLRSSTTCTILMHALFNWCTLTILILSRTGILTAG